MDPIVSSCVNAYYASDLFFSKLKNAEVLRAVTYMKRNIDKKTNNNNYKESGENSYYRANCFCKVSASLIWSTNGALRAVMIESHV